MLISVPPNLNTLKSLPPSPLVSFLSHCSPEVIQYTCDYNISSMLSREQSWGKGHILARRRSSHTTFNTEALHREVSQEEDPYGLSCLHEADGNPAATIIFVHGLNGGSRQTWSLNSGSDYNWPALWLPKAEGLGSCRILTYGYDSRYFKWSPTMAGIKDFSLGLLTEVLSDCERRPSKVCR
jgi:hypothetical protein